MTCERTLKSHSFAQNHVTPESRYLAHGLLLELHKHGVGGKPDGRIDYRPAQIIYFMLGKKSINECPA